MKYLFLLLFTILAYPQGVKISALAEAQNITQDDLFVIVDSPTSTPVTKKILFSKILDSAKVIILDYSIAQDPFTREMDDKTDRIYIPKFGNPYFAWQTDFNSGMDKIDSAVKYFDPAYFEISGDTLTASDEWALIPDSNTIVVDSVYNNASTASTSASIFRVTKQDITPAIDNTYYLGKNDDDTPLAYKGVILKDSGNGKYYRIEVINGVITATDLTD